ncbi:Fibrous sheath-interacting protein 2, partial [Frankliniella fusca]
MGLRLALTAGQHHIIRADEVPDISLWITRFVPLCSTSIFWRLAWRRIDCVQDQKRPLVILPPAPDPSPIPVETPAGAPVPSLPTSQQDEAGNSLPTSPHSSVALDKDAKTGVAFLSPCLDGDKCAVGSSPRDVCEMPVVNTDRGSRESIQAVEDPSAGEELSDEPLSQRVSSLSPDCTRTVTSFVRSDTMNLDTARGGEDTPVSPGPVPSLAGSTVGTRSSPSSVSGAHSRAPSVQSNARGSPTSINETKGEMKGSRSREVRCTQSAPSSAPSTCSEGCSTRGSPSSTPSSPGARSVHSAGSAHSSARGAPSPGSRSSLWSLRSPPPAAPARRSLLPLRVGGGRSAGSARPPPPLPLAP